MRQINVRIDCMSNACAKCKFLTDSSAQAGIAYFCDLFDKRVPYIQRLPECLAAEKENCEASHNWEREYTKLLNENTELRKAAQSNISAAAKETLESYDRAAREEESARWSKRFEDIPLVASQDVGGIDSGDALDCVVAAVEQTIRSFQERLRVENNAEGAENAALHSRIAELEAERRWVSVGPDTMPPDFADVLVSNGATRFVAHRYLGRWESPGRLLFDQEGITHYMRLPELARGHYSDCAVYNMPAYPNGPCNCGFVPLPAPPKEEV